MPESNFYTDAAVAEAYDDDAQGVPGDIDFYLALAREASPPVLELACGTGRVSIPIAAAGIPTVGLDASPAMLDVARRKSAGLEGIRWVQGDMSAFDLGERFGLIFIPFRSFQLLPSVEAQRACLECAHRHLLEGGRLALNIFNPDVARLGEWLRTSRADDRRTSGFAAGATHVRWASQSYLLASHELDDVRIEERLDAAGRAVSRTFRLSPILSLRGPSEGPKPRTGRGNLRRRPLKKPRYLFRYEMQYLLELCRFDVEALHGAFDRSPFTDTSTEMVWVARRR